MNEISTDIFISNLNENLPLGINIKNAEIFFIKSGMKKHSLSSLLWGFGYINKDKIDYIEAKEEKSYRQSRLENNLTLFSLKRNEVLAKNIIKDNGSNEWAPYFDVYRFLYK